MSKDIEKEIPLTIIHSYKFSYLLHWDEGEEPETVPNNQLRISSTKVVYLGEKRYIKPVYVGNIIKE